MENMENIENKENMENKENKVSEKVDDISYEKALDNILDKNLYNKCYKYKKYLTYIIIGSAVSYVGYKYGFPRVNNYFRK